MEQKTLVLIKPDATQNEVWLNIIRIYQRYNLHISATRILAPMPLELAEQLYAEHKGKDFYDGLIAHMTQGVTIALTIFGSNVIDIVRAINGATKHEDTADGSIRSLYGSAKNRYATAVHGSANQVDAEREVDLFFHSCIQWK